MNIDSIRKEYKIASLARANVAENPFEQFEKWMNEALASKISDPTAVSLSTIGKNGFPEIRTVLLKFFDENGFTFFTNYKSEKARSIEKNPACGLHFFWPELERQIRITGYAKKTGSEISDKYFESRPAKSRIAAWASNQSSEIPTRKYLEEQFEKFAKKFENGKIPRPEFWGGIIVEPVKIEFWQGRESRLHDRIVYEKQNEKWDIKRLAP